MSAVQVSEFVPQPFAALILARRDVAWCRSCKLFFRAHDQVVPMGTHEDADPWAAGTLHLRCARDVIGAGGGREWRRA
jgi:hypothetical protein